MRERQKGKDDRKNENAKRQTGTFKINILHVAFSDYYIIENYLSIQRS